MNIIDGHTLVFSNYDGNGMYFLTGNSASTHEIGMLFMLLTGQRDCGTRPRNADG